MNRNPVVAFLAVCLLICGVCPGVRAQDAAPGAPATAATSAPAPAADKVRVLVHTDLGDLQLELDAAHAPITVANFLRYVDQKRFDGATFYRAVRIDTEGEYGMLQGGLQGDPKRVLRPILHEATYATGLSHVSGAVSMARAEPGTATADFFIVLGDLKALDGQPTGDPGYAVFGRVAEGMELVRSMLELPRAEDAPEPSMKGQMLATPVKILSVRRMD